MSETPEDPSGIRYYGGDGTIHGNGEVNVETDKDGLVVAVWFRCQPLPFIQHSVQDNRAEEMRGLYENETRQLPNIDAIVLGETP
jgi:hypothetical protein